MATCHEHGVLCGVGNRLNFISVVWHEATVFRFVQLNARQCTSMIINLLEKRCHIAAPHHAYGGENILASSSYAIVDPNRLTLTPNLNHKLEKSDKLFYGPFPNFVKIYS